MSELAPVPFVEYLLRRYIGSVHVVLDVGCGSSLYRHTTSGRYIGIDRTDASYRLGEPRDVDVVGAVQTLPFADAVFDAVFSVSSFFLFENPPHALGELNRVLKPSGRLLLFDYNRRGQRRLERLEGARYPKWTQWGLRRLVRRAGFANAILLPAYPKRFGGVERWIRLVEEELRGQWAVVVASKPPGADGASPLLSSPGTLV